MERPRVEFEDKVYLGHWENTWFGGMLIDVLVKIQVVSNYLHISTFEESRTLRIRH